MKHINRLLAQVKTAQNGRGMHVLCFIDYDPEKHCYTARGSIWNGIPGTAETFPYSEYETLKQAVAACETIAARYPGCENVNFIMNDLSFPEVGERA